MITISSAYANKLLKKLMEEKNFIISTENKRKTYTVYASETNVVVPEYNFLNTQKQLKNIDEMILKIKHALNIFNTTTEIMDGLTIDEALVKMSIISNRLSNLKYMCDIQEIESGSNYKGETYKTYANFDHDDVKSTYNSLSKELSEIQLALDKTNMNNTFDVDIDENVLNI